MTAFQTSEIPETVATRSGSDESVLVFTSRGLLDSIRAPLFLIHPNRTLVHANPAGLRMFVRSDCIYRYKGAIACMDSESQQTLDRDLRRMCTDQTSRSVTPLRAMSGTPLPATVTCLWQCHVPAERHRTDLLLMAITDRLITSVEPQEIAVAFDLTPAEARIAGAIGAGKTPQECAEMLDVKVSTIRTHLVSIYRKTATGSQVHLARLIQTLSLF